MQLQPCPQKWSLCIGGIRHQLTLPQIKQLHAATEQLLLENDGEFGRYLNLVCMRFHISREEVLSHKRSDRICVARWTVWTLLFGHGWTLSRIAQRWKMDHSAVAWGLKALRDRMTIRPLFKQELAWLEQEAG